MRFCLSAAFVAVASGLTFASRGANVPAVSPTLREAAGGSLLIGCAMSAADASHPERSALIARQFSCVTAENELTPVRLVDDAGHYTFAAGDRVAAFAAGHHMPFVGHMLVWHHLTRDWLFQDPNGNLLSREQALRNLKQYIDTVAGHFRGRVQTWVVVNEALSDAPAEYLRDTPARRAIGDDYIEKAFEFAQAADPGAQLVYNDYNIEEPAKRAKTLRLLRSLRAKHRRVDAVGIQGHWLLDYPPADVISDAVREFHAAGFNVMVTELDVDVLPRTTSGADLQSVEQGPNPYPNGLPGEVQQSLAARYREIFDALLRQPGVTAVIFWGPDDGRSWLNDFPVKHRTNYPLLFDRSDEPKPAYDMVLGVLQRRRAAADVP